MSQLFRYSFLLALISFLIQCAKEPKASISFESEIIASTDSTITVTGKITSDGPIRFEGIVYGIDSTIAISRTSTNDPYYGGPVNYSGFVVNSAIGESFTLVIPNSQFYCKFYLKAFAISRGTAHYGPTLVYQNPTSNCYLGKGPAGGDIFYLDSLGGGLEAAPTGYNYQSWGCSGLSVAGTSTAFGSGQVNTSAIITACTSSSAAKKCDEFVLGDFEDWYLPSQEELQLIYSKLHSFNVGYYNEIYYVSSSEFNAANCYGINFTNGNIITIDKNEYYSYYRPIRKF